MKLGQKEKNSLLCGVWTHKTDRRFHCALFDYKHDAAKDINDFD